MIRSPEARLRATQVLKLVSASAPPTDVKAVAQRLGFDIIDYDFPNLTSAVTYIEAAEGVRAIGVNRRHAVVRQRFSAAHEIGHFLCGHEAFDDAHVHVEESQHQWNSQSAQEREADEFAAELLMPLEWLKRDISKLGLDVTALARRYQVSEQAMWIQLFNHGLAERGGHASTKSGRSSR